MNRVTVKAKRCAGGTFEGGRWHYDIRYAEYPGYALDECPGLAAVNRPECGWSVFHAPSGVMFPVDLPTRRACFGYMQALCANGVDWTQPEDKLAGSPAFHEAMSAGRQWLVERGLIREKPPVSVRLPAEGGDPHAG